MKRAAPVRTHAAGAAATMTPPVHTTGAAFEQQGGNRAVGRLLQRKCATCGSESCDCDSHGSHDEMQRKPASAGVGAASPVPAHVDSFLASSSGAPLDASTRRSMEAGFGQDFSEVRVHVGRSASDSARSVQAKAYTVGRDVVFGDGGYAPHTSTGRGLLAHELAHTVQQRRGAGGSGAGLEAEADAAADRVLAGRPPSKLAGATRMLQRQGTEPPLEMRIYAFSEATPAAAKKYLFDIYGFDPIMLDQCRVDGTLETGWTFVHPRLGRVARVKLSKNPGGSTYFLDEEEIFARRTPPAGGDGGGASKEKKPDADAGGGTGKDTTSGKDTKAGGGTGAAKDTQTGTGKGGTGTGQGTGAGVQPPKKDVTEDQRARFRSLPDSIKELLGGEHSLKPNNAEQLLRIAKKLEQLTPEDIRLYRLIATELAKDLDSFEKSIELYLRVKEDLKTQAAQIEAQRDAETKRKPALAEKTLEEKLEVHWQQSFDEQKFGTLDQDQRYALARQLATDQRNIQLEHMVTHPGETAVGMAEGMVRPDKVAAGMAEDLKEAFDGNKNGYARVAGLCGALGKYSGFMAGAAGIALIVLMFIPGVNVAALLTTALVLGISAIAFSEMEAQLRLSAAARSTAPGEFQTQTQKAATAEAGAIVGVAMLVVALVAKLMARIPIGGRFQTVGGALKAARSALYNKTVGPAFQAVKNDLLAKLRAVRTAKPDLRAELATQVEPLQKNADGIRAMSGDEFLQKAAAGDPVVQETGITPEQAKGLQGMASSDPAAKAAIDATKRHAVQALDSAPKEAQAKVDSFLDKLDDTIAKVDKAANADELAAAIDDGAGKVDPSRVAQEAAAEQGRLISDLALEQKFRNVPEADLRAKLATDPEAAFELARRYEGMVSQKGGVQKLEALAKTDPIAAQVLEHRKNPMQAHLRPSDVVRSRRMLIDLVRLRQASSVPKQGSTGGTLALTETDLPLQQRTYRTGSPEAKRGFKPGALDEPAQRHYKPTQEITKAQFHAEEELVNTLKDRIDAAKLTPDQMDGKTVWMAIEQEACSVCRSGLGDPLKSGTLKQFSLDHPKLTIEFTDIDSHNNTMRVWRIRNGQYVK